MSHDDQISNNSGNRPFGEVLRVNKSRRDVLAGGLGAAVTSFFAPAAAMASGGYQKPFNGNASYNRYKKTDLMGFAPVPVERSGASRAVPRISDDYEYQVIIPWGTPVNPQPGDAPFDRDNLTAVEQAVRVGIGHDGMWFFPMNGSNERGMLAINHEFGINSHVFGKVQPESLEDVRISQHAHGVAVVELQKRNGQWTNVYSPKRARRIHVNTPVTFSGPVAGHPVLGPSDRPSYGTVNNCSNGYTPWGTYLTCEENFNGYFGATDGQGNTDGTWVPTAEQDRYGFVNDGFGYGWEKFDPRFDLNNPMYAGEENRFGWIVEIDPMDATQTPVKRTAMGRFKHEGVAFTVGRGGRAVCYMGDDQRFDYIYKFVSDRNWKSMRAQGISPLDEGRLYVARFNDDGSGDWLELTIDNPALAARFNDQAEVLTYARVAADILGATPMDRPEWTTAAPDGRVYCTLTNNTRRTADDTNAANPLGPNPDGHIIRWLDSDGNTGTSFEWDIFLFAQDTRGTEDVFTDPDGLWADPDGRLFIQTDGGQPDDLNNQMVVADTNTGEIRRLFEGVAGDEITGVTVTPDRRTLFINTQHPGNGNPNLTNFPVENEIPDGQTVPRDATFVITRKDGGIVGS
jgi:secreted PhoX family phosphatase